MKQILILCSLLLIGKVANAQFEKIILRYGKQPRWVLTCDSETEETCQLTVYFPNGKKKGKARVIYHDQRNRFRPNGDAIVYFENGKILQEYNHTTGILQTYYPTGELKEKIITPINGEIEQKYKYYKTGKLWEETEGKREIGRQNLIFSHSSGNKDYIYANHGITINYQKTYHGDGTLKSYTFIDTDATHFKYVYQFFSPNGALDTKATYERRHGSMMKDGRRYRYHPNGQLREVVDYVNNKIEGEQYWWNEQGVLIQRANYKNGSRFGKYESWWDNGQHKEVSYHASYYKNGPIFRWHRDGTILEQGSYYLDIPLSLVVRRDTFGNIASERFGSMEIRDINSLYGQYYADDENKTRKLASRGQTIDGLRDGEWRYFWSKKGIVNNSSDNLCAIINYKNGLLHGKSIIYHPNGTVLLKANFDNGWLQGDYISKWTDGYIATYGKFEQHKKTGLWTRYFRQSNQINTIQLYENGSNIEMYKEWDADGFLKRDRVDNKALQQVEFYHYYKSRMYLKHVRPYGAEAMHYYQYDTAGQLKEKRILLSDNQQNYTWTKYHPNGEVKSLSTIINNKTEGIYREWYEDGRLKSEIFLENGLRQGNTYNWDKTGQATTTHFEKGIQTIPNTAAEQALKCSCNHPPDEIKSRFMSRLENYVPYDSIKAKMAYFFISEANYNQLFNQQIYYHDKRVNGTLAMFKDLFIDVNNGLRLNLTPCRRGSNRTFLEFDGSFIDYNQTASFTLRDFDLSIEFPKKLLRLCDLNTQKPLQTTIKKYEKSSVRYGVHQLLYTNRADDITIEIDTKSGSSSCFQLSEIGTTGILFDGINPEIDLLPNAILPSLRFSSIANREDYPSTSLHHFTPSRNYLRDFMGVYFPNGTVSFPYQNNLLHATATNVFISGTAIYGNIEIPTSAALSLDALKGIPKYFRQKGFDILFQEIVEDEVLYLFWRYKKS